MSKKQNTKFITPDILKGAVKGALIKLNPRYMMKNPVMFVVEIGFFITLLLSFVPGLFGDANAEQLRIYDIIVCAILFVTVLFANFAEAVAEGRGKAQAASLKKTQKDTQAHLLHEDGTQTIVSSLSLIHIEHRSCPRCPCSCQPVRGQRRCRRRSQWRLTRTSCK